MVQFYPMENEQPKTIDHDEKSAEQELVEMAHLPKTEDGS